MAEYSRRDFIKKAALAGSALPLTMHAIDANGQLLHLDQDQPKRKIYVFSKHLHWLDYTHMAEFVAECGFDGADLTVRPDGHVEPKRVEEDLPKAVEAMKKAGKEISTITTSILRADEPHAYATIKTAARLGVQCYRMGWYEYPADKSISYTLQSIEVELQKLSSLNKQLKIRGAYQNHAGDSVGSSVWDMGMLLHKVNSPWLGMQYDVRHATVEGTNSWVRGFEYVKPHINTLDIKDFTWIQRDGKWSAQNVPLGEGVVDFDKYFALIKNLPTSIPISIHYEYELGGAENGNRTVAMDAKEIMDKMKKDLTFVQGRI